MVSGVTSVVSFEREMGLTPWVLLLVGGPLVAPTGFEGAERPHIGFLTGFWFFWCAVAAFARASCASVGCITPVALAAGLGASKVPERESGSFEGPCIDKDDWAVGLGMGLGFTLDPDNAGFELTAVWETDLANLVLSTVTDSDDSASISFTKSSSLDTDGGNGTLRAPPMTRAFPPSGFKEEEVFLADITVLEGRIGPSFAVVA